MSEPPRLRRLDAKQLKDGYFVNVNGEICHRSYENILARWSDGGAVVIDPEWMEWAFKAAKEPEKR